MKHPARILSLFLPLALATPCFAQQQTFTADPNASSVAFALTGTGHEVHGTFHVQSGSIQFDRGAPKMSGSIVVSAASGESGDKGRDKKMHADVLDVEHYADVTFTPQSYTGTIAPTGDSSIQVSGTFTLHGAPHEITVPMQVHIEGSSLTAKGKFVVPYVKWGLKDPSVFILKVAKEVQIDLTLVGSLSPAS
ncbi:YceI family protein [Acidobacteria bacterium AB60]|nr:YceI family protein [Acidobacteria bacterium AB60]